MIIKWKTLTRYQKHLICKDPNFDPIPYWNELDLYMKRGVSLNPNFEKISLEVMKRQKIIDNYLNQ